MPNAIQRPDVVIEVGIDLMAVDIATGKPIRDTSGNAVLYGLDYTKPCAVVGGCASPSTCLLPHRDTRTARSGST